MRVMSIFLSLILAGCGSADDAATQAEDREPAEDLETVFDPLVGTIDKANEVEGLVMQQKQQMDDALKRMEGETEDADQ